MAISVNCKIASLRSQRQTLCVMLLTVDQELCIGCGRCEEICPAVFHLNEAIGKSEIIDEDACEFVGCCEAAEENCPVDAITFHP